MTVMDQTRDISGAAQHRLTQIFTPPEYVKKADHQTLYGEAAAMASHLYAHPAQRLYPCHTKAACWLSSVFVADNKEQHTATEYQAICQQLEKLAAYWGISEAVTGIFEKAAQLADVNLLKVPDSDFALVWQDEKGNKQRQYPLRNALEVKEASTWFVKYRDEFTFSDKHTIAKKILEKAAALGAVTADSELLSRCAGYGYCPAEGVRREWLKRAQLTKHNFPDYSAAATNMANTLQNATFEVRDQGLHVKMAEVLSQFDQTCRLSPLYGTELERPEDVIFQVTEKVAGDFVTNHVLCSNGAIYEKIALERLNIDQVRDWFGEDFADSVGGVMLNTEKLAELLPTLPRPDAALFERMADSVGVQPFGRQKVADHVPQSELSQFAAAYRT